MHKLSTTKEAFLSGVACMLVRLPWIFMVPMKEAPDEFAHFWVYRFLSDNLRLPWPSDITQGGASSVYGPLPPLGYLPHVLVCKLVPWFEISLVGRFGSLLMGVVTVVSSYFIGKEIFPTSSVLAWALPLVLIFQPQLVFVDAYANNDSSACALSSLLFLVLIVILKRGLRPLSCLAMGALTGWLVLSKYSALCLLPALFLGLLASGWMNNQPALHIVAYLSATGATAALLSGWWFQRNGAIFGGDYLGMRTMRDNWAAVYHHPPAPYTHLSQILKDRFWWSMTWTSFWGRFGYMTTPMWAPIYQIYLIFSGAAVAAGAFDLVRSKKESKSENSASAANQETNGANRKRFLYPIIWSLFLLTILINFAGLLWGTLQNLGNGQGRYLFPCIVPIVSFLILGLSRAPKWGGRLVVAFVILNALAYVLALAMLEPLYGFRLKPY